MKLAVIGTGNMGRALLSGFVNGGIIKPEEAWCFDVYTEACTKCAESLGVNAASSAAEACEGADYILMAVKPVHFDDALKSIKDSLKPEAIVLSIAAAVTCGRISGILGNGRKFVRIMPNTPAQVGLGVSAVCPVGLDGEETEFVLKLLETCGETILCDENTLDAIGCVSGTGPAYVMLFIEAMADAAVREGIPRVHAYEMAAQSVLGSALMVMSTGTHPAALKDAVCSPGGTTIEAVAELERKGFRSAIMDAMKVCADKSREMSSD